MLAWSRMIIGNITKILKLAIPWHCQILWPQSAVPQEYAVTVTTLITTTWIMQRIMSLKSTNVHNYVENLIHSECNMLKILTRSRCGRGTWEAEFWRSTVGSAGTQPPPSKQPLYPADQSAHGKRHRYGTAVSAMSRITKRCTCTVGFISAFVHFSDSNFKHNVMLSKYINYLCFYVFFTFKLTSAMSCMLNKYKKYAANKCHQWLGLICSQHLRHAFLSITQSKHLRSTDSNL